MICMFSENKSKDMLQNCDSVRSFNNACNYSYIFFSFARQHKPARTGNQLTHQELMVCLLTCLQNLFPRLLGYEIKSILCSRNGMTVYKFWHLLHEGPIAWTCYIVSRQILAYMNKCQYVSNPVAQSCIAHNHLHQQQKKLSSWGCLFTSTQG